MERVRLTWQVPCRPWQAWRHSAWPHVSRITFGRLAVDGRWYAERLGHLAAAEDDGCARVFAADDAGKQAALALVQAWLDETPGWESV